MNMYQPQLRVPLKKLKQSWSWEKSFAWIPVRSEVTGKIFWLKTVYRKEITFRPFVNGPAPYANIAARIYARRFRKCNHYTSDIFEVLENLPFTDAELKRLEKKWGINE